MHEELLSEAGLTQNESKVYMTLLSIGKSKSGRILKESGISGGKIYETLYKLHDKGLVSVSIEKGIKMFFASDPESILHYMEDKKKEITEQEEKLKTIMPELKGMQKSLSDEDSVSFIKDLHGIRPIVYEILNGHDELIKIMGVRSSKGKTYNIFWRQWHNERAKLGKNAQMLFTDTDTEYYNSLKEMKHTELRYTLSLSPSSIMVIGRHTLIFSYEEGFTCVHIKSEPIARSFSAFFDKMWEMSEE